MRFVSQCHVLSRCCFVHFSVSPIGDALMRGLHVEFCICFPGILLLRILHQLLIGDNRGAYCIYLWSINAAQMMPPCWTVYHWQCARSKMRTMVCYGRSARNRSGMQLSSYAIELVQFVQISIIALCPMQMCFALFWNRNLILCDRSRYEA